jgi:serine phosphatase RsbU (regulator of sigma subunit)
VSVALLPDGALQSVDWSPGGSIFQSPDEKTRVARAAFVDRMEDVLANGRVKRGESFYNATNFTVRVRPLASEESRPRETLVLQQPGSSRLQLSLQLSDPEAPQRYSPRGIARQLYKLIPPGLLFLLTAILFGVLLYRRRLGFRIGLILMSLATLYMIAGGLSTEETRSGGFVVFYLLLRVVLLVYLLGLWTVGESLLRDTVPGFTTSLDAFAARQLGPRGGRAIFAGLGTGAALLGVRLLGISIAAMAAPRGVQPKAPSFPYPLFELQADPFYEGAFDTALFVLLVALGRFVLPRKWAGIAAAVVFALYQSLGMPLQPWGAGLALSLLLAILFLQVFAAHGFAALLVAALSSSLFRDALVSGRFLGENLLPALLTFLPLLALMAVGAASLRRPERDDEGRIEAPHYVRRLESERRVKYEMDLLSRVQLSLLPEKPPLVPGLELAVKTILATEAGGDLYEFIRDEEGGLWIAAGDVSGHGYSCGIQQAMVMASLASLVKAGRRPSEILQEVDRVLRMGRSSRLFTSAALLRFDPKTGQGILANAGHPFPLLLFEGKCREIAGSGLPLGQGPKRTYEDISVEVPGGGVLVIASDGLYEGPDRFDVPYGYDRPRVVLESTSLWRRPADSIMEAVFADWRLHVGEGAPADDTTVLVVKRLLF